MTFSRNSLIALARFMAFCRLHLVFCSVCVCSACWIFIVGFLRFCLHSLFASVRLSCVSCLSARLRFRSLESIGQFPLYSCIVSVFIGVHSFSDDGSVSNIWASCCCLDWGMSTSHNVQTHPSLEYRFPNAILVIFYAFLQLAPLFDLVCIVCSVSLMFMRLLGMW